VNSTPLIKVFISFRFRQALRELKGLGWLYSSVLVIFFGGIFYISMKASYLNQDDRMSYLLFSPVLMLYFIRRDIPFLRKLIIHPFPVLLADYFIIGSPYLLYCALTWNFSLLIIALAFILLFSMMPFRHSKSNYFQPGLNFISSDAYEWKAGLRKNSLVLILLYIFALSTVAFPAVSLLLCFLMHSIFTAFYQPNESISLLRVQGNNPKKILREKITRGLILQTIIFLPVAIVNSCMQDYYAYVWLFFLSTASISLSFSIISKYSYYRPETANSPSQVNQAISIFSFIIPFLLPIPLLLSILRFPSAIQKIKDHVA
jgi:hypothetical protein